MIERVQSETWRNQWVEVTVKLEKQNNNVYVLNTAHRYADGRPMPVDQTSVSAGDVRYFTDSGKAQEEYNARKAKTAERFA